mmetsp:Transcript_63558/g.164999  ORF Transcript_63558/g.164999 Transcript_63558/m.164999 type:complete len:228 (+) Transcript_63558:116-799(+)
MTRGSVRLPCQLDLSFVNRLDDELRHVSDCRVIEHQGHRQVDTRKFGGQLIAQQDGRVTGQSGLHQRCVRLEFVVLCTCDPDRDLHHPGFDGLFIHVGQVQRGALCLGHACRLPRRSRTLFLSTLLREVHLLKRSRNRRLSRWHWSSCNRPKVLLQMIQQLLRPLLPLLIIALLVQTESLISCLLRIPVRSQIPQGVGTQEQGRSLTGRVPGIAEESNTFISCCQCI